MFVLRVWFWWRSWRIALSKSKKYLIFPFVAFLFKNDRKKFILECYRGLSVFPVANFGTFLKISCKIPLHCTLESFLSLRFACFVFLHETALSLLWKMRECWHGFLWVSFQLAMAVFLSLSVWFSSLRLHIIIEISKSQWCFACFL